MVLGKVKSKKRSKNKDGKHQSRRRNGDTALPTLERIAVEDVEVIGKHREVDPEKVKSLAASIAMIGLRTPITVRRIEKGFSTTFALVAGGHRLEAAKKLGWEHIDAFIIEGNETDARICQLMENLYRADLTPLQRAEDVAELIGLVLENAKEVQLAPPGGQQPHDRGIKKAAKALGLSRDEVRRSLDIAAISEEAKERAKEEGLDKKQSTLLKIAKEQGSEAQIAKIEEIGTGKSASASKASSSTGTVTKKDKKPNGAELEKAEEPEAADAEVANSPSSGSEYSNSNSEYPALPASLDRNRGNDERLFTALKAAWGQCTPLSAQALRN